METSIRNSPHTFIKFKLSELSNGTYIAKIDHEGVGNITRHIFGKGPYDDKGALIYVVAVVCIYGLSILLMIASVIKKDKSDHGLSKYMNDIDKIHRLEKRQEKFKTRLAMQRSKNRSLPTKIAPPAGMVPKHLGEPSSAHLDKSLSYGSTSTISSSKTSPHLSEEQQLLLAPSSCESAPTSPDVTQQRRPAPSIYIDMSALDDNSDYSRGKSKDSSPQSALQTLHEVYEEDAL